MSRCDSAAIVPNTSELLPDPETPVNTVSRRFGISMLTSLRLFTRAPCTRIRSWRSAACRAGDGVSVLVATLMLGMVGRAALAVLDQAEDVAIRVGHAGHQAATTHVAGGLVQGGARGDHLGQLRVDVRHVPVGHG